MRRAFEADVEGITGLRCMVLIGMDQEVLGKWSQTVAGNGVCLWTWRDVHN
jgi:ubiquitin-protein ligase E3 C